MTTMTTGILKPTTLIPTVIGLGSKIDLWTRIAFTTTIHQPVRTTNTNHDEVTIRTEVSTDMCTRIAVTTTIHQPVRTTNTNHDEVIIRTEVTTDVTLGHVTSVRSKGT